jgi:putative ABC transport system permease protein
MGYYNNGDALIIEGRETPAGQPTPNSLYTVVSTDYFKTMRIPLLSGRSFTEADSDRAPYVAVVNETLAKRYWPNQDPIGKQLRLGADDSHVIQVVGVSRDSRIQGATGTIQTFFYVPFEQHSKTSSLETLQVRTAGAPSAMIPQLEHVLNTLAPDLPLFDVKTMTLALNTLNGLLTFELAAILAAALGSLGLVLSIVGVYGVVSYAANQRTHEIGIRIALGAQPADILKMIFRQGLVVVGIGLVLGLAVAFAAARVVGNFLAVSATDPLTYFSVSALLTLVALTACYVPARRAMRVDPMVALRYE